MTFSEFPRNGNGSTRLTLSSGKVDFSSISQDDKLIDVLPFFRVLMLGGDKVGKSSLVSQFMTSEYLHAYDTSIGEFPLS